MPKAGGPAQQLHEKDAHSIAIDDDHVFWSGEGGIWRLAR